MATLIRLLGDFDRAEDALHDAFRAALEQWPVEGRLANPSAWLISDWRFTVIDTSAARLDSPLEEAIPEIRGSHGRSGVDGRQNYRFSRRSRLRLIFTCRHPALALEARVALTLREVCGLATEEIARAFLTAPATLAQRIVRAKKKIKEARIPW